VIGDRVTPFAMLASELEIVRSLANAG